MPDYDDLRHLGDELEEPLRNEFLRMIRAAETYDDLYTGVLNRPELAAMIQSGNTAGIQRLAQELVAKGLIESSLDFINIMYTVMARAGLAVLPAAGFEGSLAMPLREAVLDTVRTFAMNRGAERVTGISLDTVASMRLVMEDALKRGVGARAFGRELHSSIGLLPSHERALQNYRAMLEARGVPEAKAEKLYNTYRRRLLAWRAEMIARTETMFAVHAGMMAGWQAQLRAGILMPQRTWIEWVVTEDDRLCDRCAPMHEKRVRFGQPFWSTERGFPPEVPRPHTDSPKDREERRRGSLRPKIPVYKGYKPVRVWHPPLHPNCRCTLRLHFE